MSIFMLNEIACVSKHELPRDRFPVPVSPFPFPHPMSAPLTLLKPAIFDQEPSIVAAFSTRHGGVSTGDYASLNLGLSTADDRLNVLENRRRFFEALGFPVEALAVPGQVHGTAVLSVTAAGLYPGYDALVTAQQGLLLCISAADCAAVLLADATAGVIGAAHAGWRGAAGGIVGKTVAVMQTLGATPAYLRAYISPCISAAHFEVGPEVAAQFDPAFVHLRPGQRPHVDLKAALAAQLHTSGVRPEAVEVVAHCTVAEHHTFFSHRADRGTTGRMMGCIGLR